MRRAYNHDGYPVRVSSENLPPLWQLLGANFVETMPVSQLADFLGSQTDRCGWRHQLSQAARIGGKRALVASRYFVRAETGQVEV